MNEKGFTVKLEGTTLHVTLGFELSAVNSETLKDMLIPYEGQAISEIVFDATNLVFLSSSGIRTIYFAQRNLGHEPKIVFVNCPAEIYDTLRITGISNFISFVEDERKNSQSAGAEDVDAEWKEKFEKIRQKQLEYYSANNDVVVYQMKLGQEED